MMMMMMILVMKRSKRIIMILMIILILLINNIILKIYIALDKQKNMINLGPSLQVEHRPSMTLLHLT